MCLEIRVAKELGIVLLNGQNGRVDFLWVYAGE